MLSVKLPAFLIVMAFASMLFPTPVNAQSNAHLALGVDVTKRVYTDDAFHIGVRPSLTYRFRRHRHPNNGWRFRVPEFGLNWLGADVTMPVAGEDTKLGHINIRPLLVGVAEALVLHDGKDELSFGLLVGPAFTSFRESGAARDAYRLRLGTELQDIHAKNTFVIRPGVSYWHDLSNRFGLHLALNYAYARPGVTIKTSAGTTSSTWTADNFAFKAGIAVGVW